MNKKILEKADKKILKELEKIANSVKKHYKKVYVSKQLKGGVTLGMGTAAAKKELDKFTKITTNIRRKITTQSKGPVGQQLKKKKSR
jgi:HSP90 family molecular chaperone